MATKKKRYVYFGGLLADTKTMESVNPDKSRRPLTKKERSVVQKLRPGYAWEQKINCDLLKRAVEDEKKAARFYDKLSEKLNPSDRAKVKEIGKEEATHKKELLKIMQKSICKVF